MNYRSNLIAINGADYFTIEEISESYLLEVPDFDLPIQLPFNETVSIARTEQLDLTVLNEDGGGDDYQIQQIKFDQGTIQLNAENDFQHNIEIELTMPVFLKNGLPLQLSIHIPRGGNRREHTDWILGFITQRDSLNLGYSAMEEIT